jgi:hypothetical protein
LRTLEASPEELAAQVIDDLRDRGVIA